MAIASVLDEADVDVIKLLVKNEVISVQEGSEVRAMMDPTEKASKLLLLASDSNKSMKQFDQLLNVLDRNEHRRLVDEIRQQFGKLIVNVSFNNQMVVDRFYKLQKWLLLTPIYRSNDS